MAEPSPVSDTQVLLQSMLQRLKLQTHAERGEIHKQEYASSPAKLDVECAGSSSEAVFGNSMDKQQRKSPSIGINLDSLWSVQSSSKSHEGISATSGWDYMNSHGPQGVISPINNGETPKWKRKQLKVSERKASDGSGSITSVNSGHSGVRTQGVGVGDTKRDEINVTEQITRTRTSRTSKRKWSDPVKKRWTLKVKERWRERHKKEGDGKQKQEPTEEAKSNHCPAPIQPTGNNTTAAFIEENKIEQHQPINSEPDEAPPSPLDHMSETIFSVGSFNLMEEIFSGMEWAKFFPSSADHPLETTCITPDTSTSQTPHGGLSMGNRRDHEEATERMNSESYQQDMNIAEDTFNQTKTSAFSLPFFQNFELFKDQSELFDLDSDQLQSMDLSVGQSENGDQPKCQAHLPDMHQSHQPKTTTEASVLQSLSSEQNPNHSQPSDSIHTPPEFLPLLDLSYLKDSSSLQMHGPLSRKRGHCTLRRGSSDRGRPETGQVQDWRDDAVIPLHSVRPVPSLSPSSSISSLQYSISQDSESSASTETVVKKRRLENTRRVRFAEEVLFLPPLILSEDDETDSVFAGDDDDYGGGGGEDGEAGDDDDCPEHPQSRPSIPNWILALRTKTKRRPKLKFPRKSSTPTKI